MVELLKDYIISERFLLLLFVDAEMMAVHQDISEISVYFHLEIIGN